MNKADEDQNRSGKPYKSCEDSCLVANHNASDFTLETSDAEFIKLIDGRRPRISFPPAVYNR